MREIDKSKPVLVTGGAGYMASWIIKMLLEEGITVHATVRDPSDYNKVGHLTIGLLTKLNPARPESS